MSRKPLSLLLGTSTTAFLAAAFMGLAAQAADQGTTLSPQDHVLGSPKAKVVLIEYGALVCPHCAHFNEDVIPDLKKNYIDTGKVLYVFRLFPLSKEDGMAEKIANCMPKDQYFATVDKIFHAQPQWDYEYGIKDGPAQLAKLGQSFGLSAQKVQQCMADTGPDARINQVAAEAQSRYHVEGTPTLVINGKPQEAGGMSYEDLSKALDQAAKGG